MLGELARAMTWVDWVGFVWFFVCWGGYGWLAERGTVAARGLQGATHRERLLWARQMMKRDQRIADVSLVGNLMNSVSFYANTSIYVLAGLVALLGALDRVMQATSGLPFAFGGTREMLEFKLIMLVLIFVYAYFKFTWSLRQFNVLSITIGAAPVPEDPADDRERHARRIAAVNASAGDDFNAGIRAYYFGLAVVTWCINATLFVAVTTAIAVVLARRDYFSRTLRALRDD